MKATLLLTIILSCTTLTAQELYVFSEPASNMPAHSLSVKENWKVQKNKYTGTRDSRYTTELMFGINKNLMVHTVASFSNMYSGGQQFEGGKLYAKYRIFSKDDLFSHLRIAAYAEGAITRKESMYDEYSFDGDKSGVGGGAIITQLLHKFAISGTTGFKVTSDPYGNSGFTVINYSLSAGYLLLPKTYTDYKQTNLNLYLELLGGATTRRGGRYLDIAPAAQLIFNSQAKLNLGYRFQVDGNMYRMAEKSWMISFEWLFLNAL